MKFLQKETYFQKVREMMGEHWTKGSINKRWDYHARVVNLLKSLNLKDSDLILEMGTMGITCTDGSHTIDYAERWDFPGKKPDYLHDARNTPWPIADKKYEVFIALRVYQHLAPKQKEALAEAFRIAKKVIIVVDSYYKNAVVTHSKGISYSDFVNYLGGVHPNIFTQTAQGELYYWDSEKPSNINIENVMMSQIEATDRKSQLDNRYFLKKVKRKIKRMIS